MEIQTLAPSYGLASRAAFGRMHSWTYDACDATNIGLRLFNFQLLKLEVEQLEMLYLGGHVKQVQSW